MKIKMNKKVYQADKNKFKVNKADNITKRWIGSFKVNDKRTSVDMISMAFLSLS